MGNKRRYKSSSFIFRNPVTPPPPKKNNTLSTLYTNMGAGAAGPESGGFES